MRILLTLVLFVLSYSDDIYSQSNPHWKQIGYFDLLSHNPQFGQSAGDQGYGIVCAFFFDDQRGLIGRTRYLVQPHGPSEIYLTVNQGKTWTKAVIPEPEISKHGTLESIWMKDTARGFAVVRGYNYYDTSLILGTSDGGLTWKIDSIGKEWYYGSFRNGLIGDVHGTLPNGTPIVADGGIASQGSDTILIALVNGAGILGSTDKGQSWTYTLPDIGDEYLGDPWGAANIRSRNAFYVLPYETGIDPANRYVFESTDVGKTWTPVSGNFLFDHRRRTGNIQAAGEALYIQARKSSLVNGKVEEGFYRSLDGGRNWKHVGGPMRRPYTRFSVPPTCNGNIVVGFDSTTVWMTTDGGDGLLLASVPPIVEAKPFVPIPTCLDTASFIRLENVHCRTIVFTGAELIQTDDAFAFDTVGLFPIVLKESEFAEIPIRFLPALRVKSFKAVVKLTGYEELPSGTRTIDTSVAISATSLAVAPKLTADNSTVAFLGTSTCFTRDTLITVTNTGCDTLTLDDVIGSGSAYSFSSVQKPLRLAPGESVTVTVTFHPSTQGNHFGNLQLVATQQGITKKTDIPLSGVGTAGEGLLALETASDVKLPQLSICASGSDTLGIVRNTGCAAIIVKNVAIAGSSDYTLMNPINNVRLEPDSSLTFRVKFVPQDKGARNGTITITWTDENGNNPKDITVALGANVIDGTKALASSLNTINFGETNICEERDSVVSFTNTGCDTLTITAADIDKNFSVGDDVLPIVLAPGESVELPITTIVDTTGKPRVLTGVLNVSSTADNQITPITLTRELYYPTRLRIEALDEASGKQGDVVKFRVLLEGQVPSTMTALHFDFLHNADLLSWDGYDGIGLNRTNISGNESERASFTLSPVHDDIIGEFTFKTNLALAEQTTLSFDNISFEAKGVSIAPECIAVISDTGTRFNYIYTCGDNIIRDRLNGTRLIKSITPNPASGEIRLELNAKDAQVAIIDMLGAEVLRTSATDHIDVSDLPSGTYYVRVSASGDVQTKRIVIQR